ncbi:MAG: glycosyltransferase family 39 protein [Gemmatimonadetes bacterium]|nr:glycosyltransferase family 39 protein [Gemmatimonadota bacterium]
MRWAWRVVGTGLIVLPALPIARWVHAADQGPASWHDNLLMWGMGLAGIAVTALVAGRVTARYRPRSIPRLAPLRPWLPGILALALAGLAAFVARSAFSANPQLIDEVAQLFQARIFASGRLTAPPPSPAESFLFQLTTVTPAGWVSQFPPGQSLLLALGMLVHAEWLVNPLLGAIGVILVYRLARGLYGPRTALPAAFLWAACSWVLFMSASYMNHVGAATFALAAWALLWGPRRLRPIHLAAAGAALAATAATRPLDAVAAAVPIGIWILLRLRIADFGVRSEQPALETSVSRPGTSIRNPQSAIRNHTWGVVLKSVAWMALGTVPIILAWGYLNWRLFGNPLKLGYSALYGPALNLGFHQDPYGQSFTPWVALSNMAVALRRLHLYLYEWPVPALLPFAAWALLSRHRHPSDAILAAGAVAAPLLYFFYWHSGFYLGPRFYYVAIPWLVIGTARAWVWAWARARRWRSSKFATDGALATAAILTLWWGWTGFLPARFQTYRDSFPTLKMHLERELTARGVDRAVVLVPESWGSRVIAGLWALGVPPGLVEAAYRRVDLCDLHFVQRQARAAGVPPSEASRAVSRLDHETSAPVARIPGAPDPSLRLRTDRPLAAECRTELERDLDGFTVYGNLAWRNPVVLDHGIIFARDRHAQNTELLTHYPGWDVWRFAPPPGRPNDIPILTRQGR